MGGAGQLQAAPHHWIKQRCLAGIEEFVETRFCKMFLVKRFKCLLVAFLLLSASPTTLSHGQEYQSTNGANQRVPMCVACCTITLVAMILLVCFLVTHPYVATQTWITTSGCMCRFLRHLLTAAVIIGTFTVIDSLLNDSSNQMVFHHGVRNATSKAISLPIAFVGGAEVVYMSITIAALTAIPDEARMDSWKWTCIKLLIANISDEFWSMTVTSLCSFYQIRRVWNAQTESPSLAHGIHAIHDNHYIKLEIRGIDGEVLDLRTESGLTGLELKEWIYGINGIPPHFQRLFMGSKTVANSSIISNNNTIQLQVLAHGGGLTTPCGLCGVKEAEFSCTECHSMLLCSLCNVTWHDNNPNRQGHAYTKIQSGDPPIKEQSIEGADSGVSFSNSNSSVSIDPCTSDDEFFDLISDSYQSQDLEDKCKLATLAQYFHYTAFKPYQAEVISHHLKGQDTIVIQPTGSGKSICFQFPAVYTGKMTLVICPTISLMHDQVHSLKEKGLKAEYLGSGQVDKTIESKVLSDTGDVQIAFVTPEWLFNGNKLHQVQMLSSKGRIGLIAIDEAHLVFDWATFRSKYSLVESIKEDFPNIPIMALTATAPPKMLLKLKGMLKEPYISQSSINRENISLYVEKMPDKGPTSHICRGSYTGFARRIKDIISKQCCIVYTDFVADVGPILEALRNERIECVGYYGEMDSVSKHEAYTTWREGSVQAIVATKAFGMGIDKPDIRYIIRHGVPECLSSWLQELGRAGRDGNPSQAYIFYDERDTDNACAWIRDHLQNQQAVTNILKNFSESWRYIYAHLTGTCRRKILLEVFGENSDNPSATVPCCDVCSMNESTIRDHRREFEIAADAIDHLGCYGEVKITEWIRGSKRAWMSDKNTQTLSFSNHCDHSDVWWRTFLRKCHVLGLLERRFKNIVKSSGQYVVFACYSVTNKGRLKLSDCSPVLVCESIASPPKLAKPLSKRKPLVQIQRSYNESQASGSKSTLSSEQKVHTKIGKGSRIIDTVKELMKDSSTWLHISTKQEYQFPGVLKDVTNQYMLHSTDVRQLPQATPDNPHFMWSDIQIAKGKMNIDRKIKVTIDGIEEELFYRMAPCGGVKKCPESGCSYVCAVKDHPKCPTHGHTLKLPADNPTRCPVTFVYLHPTQENDYRRWIAGLVNHQKEPLCNLHTHEINPPSRISSLAASLIHDSQQRDPTLTARDLSIGKGSGVAIGAVDQASNHLGRVRYQLSKSKKQHRNGDVLFLLKHFQEVINQIDEKDDEFSGENSGASLVETTAERYRSLGRPYLRTAGFEESITYMLVMSPLMSQVLVSAPFIEADITYDETTQFPYTFNVTAFDDVLLQWIVVCRIRVTSQSAQAYALCFMKTFEQCKKDHPNFTVGESLVGVVVDWSDAQCNGLRLALGKELADKLLRGCEVHWNRSYQRVSEKVCKHHHPAKRQIAKQAFHLIAAAITKAKSQDQVYRLFRCLCGELKVCDVRALVPGLLSHHVDVVDSGPNDWKSANHWVSWWTRLNHLRMLCKPFTTMNQDHFEQCPRTTNAVERHNRECKEPQAVDLQRAFIHVYRIDKAVTLRHIAASKNTLTIFPSNTSLGRVKQRKKTYPLDKKATQGPPDKNSNFGLDLTRRKRPLSTDSDDEFAKTQKPNKKVTSKKAKTVSESTYFGRKVRVLFDDGNTYPGVIVRKDPETNMWVTVFEDGVEDQSADPATDSDYTLLD